jgi:hypothetical protein
MSRRFDRITELLIPATLAVMIIATASWAGPPPPPVIQAIPSTPVGGTEATIATTIAIAAYGIWKSRK